jgi:hypothetical protein
MIKIENVIIVGLFGPDAYGCIGCMGYLSVDDPLSQVAM